MTHPIDALIATTEAWLAEHRRAGRKIEAAACAIRLKALRDAASSLRGRDGCAEGRGDPHA